VVQVIEFEEITHETLELQTAPARIVRADKLVEPRLELFACRSDRLEPPCFVALGRSGQLCGRPRRYISFVVLRPFAQSRDSFLSLGDLFVGIFNPAKMAEVLDAPDSDIRRSSSSRVLGWPAAR
jgi:hypothetical protein